MAQEENAYSHYIELTPVKENQNFYDDLQRNEVKTAENNKQYLKIVLLSILVAFLSSGVTYMIVHFLQNKNMPDKFKSTLNDTACKLDPLQSLNNFPLKLTTCPETWESYLTFCFKEYTTKKTWQQAQFACLSVGADLLSIHNQNETEFLKRRFSSDSYWLGLNDLADEGHFIWSDGSEVNFTNWRPGEPINYRNNEDCVELYYNAVCVKLNQ